MQIIELSDTPITVSGATALCFNQPADFVIIEVQARDPVRPSPAVRASRSPSCPKAARTFDHLRAGCG
jgi:hypothetical protein